MSDFTTKTDTLAAVNTMLACAGEGPVSTLDEGTNLMARLAYNVLVEVHRAVLSKGWTFNTDLDYMLTPDSQGNINIGSDMISVDVRPYNSDKDPVIRGTKLYSRKDQSYTWSEPLKTDVVWLLEYEDLPEQARNYIKIRAARTFVQRHVGDNSTYEFTANDEAQALADIKGHELKQGDFNVFKKWSVARILDRSPRRAF